MQLCAPHGVLRAARAHTACPRASRPLRTITPYGVQSSRIRGGSRRSERHIGTPSQPHANPPPGRVGCGLDFPALWLVQRGRWAKLHRLPPAVTHPIICKNKGGGKKKAAILHDPRRARVRTHTLSRGGHWRHTAPPGRAHLDPPLFSPAPLPTAPGGHAQRLSRQLTSEIDLAVSLQPAALLRTVPILGTESAFCCAPYLPLTPARHGRQEERRRRRRQQQQQEGGRKRAQGRGRPRRRRPPRRPRRPRPRPPSGSRAQRTAPESKPGPADMFRLEEEPGRASSDSRWRRMVTFTHQQQQPRAPPPPLPPPLYLPGIMQHIRTPRRQLASVSVSVC